MTKQSHETMIALCEALVNYPVHGQACDIAGITTRTMYRWMDTPETDPTFVFEWHGKTAHLAAHIKTAMRLNAIQIEAFARKMCTEEGGFEEVLTGKDGRICYKEREDIILAGDADLDKETLMMLYGQPDIYERDEAGRRIPIKIKRAPPAPLMNKMLSAHFPKLYGDHSSVSVSGNSGVMIVGSKKPPRPVDVTPRAAITQAPAPKFEDAAQPAELVSEPEPDIVEPDVGEDTPSRPVEVMPEPPRDLPGDVDPPEQVTTAPEEPPQAAHPQPTQAAPMSALKADLLKRLQIGVKNPQPSKPVNTGTSLLTNTPATREN